MIRVVVADDHPLIRLGLAAILAEQPDIVVCGVAGSGEDAVVRVRDQAPDVVLLDLSMPGSGGLAAAAEIVVGGTDTRALILTCQDDAAHIRAALDVGASGYVLKDASVGELVAAVRAVHRGELVLSADAARALEEDTEEDAALTAARPRRYSHGGEPRIRTGRAGRPTP
ncbi:response regulator [Nocardioides ultimimeridianus]